MAEEEAASAVSALSLDAVTAAGVAEKIREGDASTSFAVFALEDEAAAVTLLEHGAGDIGSVAPRLPQGNVRFVYGRVVLDESKGGLDHVAAAGLGRRKLVLLTWVGEDTPPRERGAVSALRAALKNKIPELVVHCELSATTAADAEQAGIVEKVKTASGAFYDSGACGADQTTEATSEGAGSTEVTAKARPKGGRKLVRKSA